MKLHDYGEWTKLVFSQSTKQDIKYIHGHYPAAHIKNNYPGVIYYAHIINGKIQYDSYEEHYGKSHYPRH